MEVRVKGQIIKISSDLYFVSCENEVYPCKCRGIFRKEHITPVVGDYVLFNKDKKLIEEVLPRKNIFQRPKVSNIDQAFLITSLKEPDFSLNLLYNKIIANVKLTTMTKDIFKNFCFIRILLKGEPTRFFRS